MQGGWGLAWAGRLGAVPIESRLSCRVMHLLQVAEPAPPPQAALHHPLASPLPNPSQLLDWLLGEESALFRRQELKALVGIHAEPQQDGSGGDGVVVSSRGQTLTPCSIACHVQRLSMPALRRFGWRTWACCHH